MQNNYFLKYTEGTSLSRQSAFAKK